MAGYLLDTNVISELTKLKPEPKVTEWLESISEDLLYISVLTIGEIRKGIVAMEHGRRRLIIQSWLETDLKPRFARRVLPIDEAIAERWGAVAGEAAVEGISVPVIDGLLDATALHPNLTLATRNIRDFAGTHVVALNPWEPD